MPGLDNGTHLGVLVAFLITNRNFRKSVTSLDLVIRFWTIRGFYNRIRTMTLKCHALEMDWATCDYAHWGIRPEVPDKSVGDRKVKMVHKICYICEHRIPLLQVKHILMEILILSDLKFNTGVTPNSWIVATPFEATDSRISKFWNTMGPGQNHLATIWIRHTYPWFWCPDGPTSLLHLCY